MRVLTDGTDMHQACMKTLVSSAGRRKGRWKW